MRYRFAALCISVLALSLTAQAQFSGSYDPRYGSNAGKPGGDESYIEQEMNIVSAEIEWSQIAASKGTNPDVKALANETVTEDAPVAGRLIAEAKAAKVAVPNGLSGKYKKESEKLNSLSGAAFDKEYVTSLIKVQHEDVGTLLDEAKSTRNPALESFAEKTGNQVSGRNDSAKMLDKMLVAK